MRKLLFGLMAIVALVASSCEPTSGGHQHETVFELTSSDKLRVDYKGGDFDITYALSYPMEGTEVKTTIVNSAMITAADTSTEGVVKITVAKNTSDAVREGAVVVSYGALSFTVVVEQDYYSGNQNTMEEVTVAANQLVGNYYGDNLASGVGHYWIILSEDGFVDGSAVAGAEYFRLDILGPMPTDMENIKVPDGTYTYDYAANVEPYTIINIGNTDHTWVDENMEGWATPLESATLKVSGNRFELVAVANHTQYTVTFEGDYSLSHNTINDYVSSLTKDTVIDVSNCSASVSSYGDYWACGYNNWGIEFVCNDGLYQGAYLVIDFLSTSTSNFTGTYVASGFSEEDPTKPDFRGGVFVPGFRVADDADLLLGSLFMVYKDGLCVSQAPLYEGTVTITSNGDGSYTIIIDALDDAPEQHKITLTWTGYFE